MVTTNTPSSLSGSGAMGLFTSSSTLVIAGALSLHSNVAHLALPTALPAGTYHMATDNPTGSIGEFATAPIIDSGSLIAGGTTNGVKKPTFLRVKVETSN